MLSTSLISIILLEVIKFAPISSITAKVSSYPQEFRRHSAPPPTDWEPGLREAAHQAFLRERYNIPNLRDVMLHAPIIGESNKASPFGDIAILARGQIFSSQSGFKFVQDPYQNDCVDCHRRSLCTDDGECDFYQGSENLEALWTVKRIRHRDSDYGHRYELEYTISPIHAEDRTGYVTRGGSFDYSRPGHVFVVKTNTAQTSDNLKWYKHATPHNYFGTTQSTRYNRVKGDRLNHPVTPNRFYLPYRNPYYEKTPSTTPSDEDEIELFKNLVQSLSQQTSTSQFKPTKFPHRFGPPTKYPPTTVGTNFLKPTQNTIPYSPTVPYDSKFSSTQFPYHNTGNIKFPTKPTTTHKTTYFIPQEEIPIKPHTTTPKTTYFIPTEDIPIKVTNPSTNNPYHTIPSNHPHSFKPTKPNPVTYHTTITKTTSNRPVVHYTTDVYTIPNGPYTSQPYFTTNPSTGYHKPTIFSTQSTNIPSSVYSTQSSKTPTITFPSKIPSTTSTKIHTTYSTQSTNVPSTLFSPQSSKVPSTTFSTNVPSTIYSPQTSKIPSTIFSTQSTNVPETSKIPSTIFSTQSTKVPSTIFSTESTKTPSTTLIRPETTITTYPTNFPKETTSPEKTTSSVYFGQETESSYHPTTSITKATFEPTTIYYTKPNQETFNKETTVSNIKETEFTPSDFYTKTTPSTNYYTKETSLKPTDTVYYTKETTPTTIYYTKETTKPGFFYEKESTVEKNTQQTTQTYQPTYTVGKPVPTFYIDPTHPGYPRTTPTTPFTDSYQIHTVQTPPPTKPQFVPSPEDVHYSEPYPTHQSSLPSTSLTSPTTFKLPITTDRYFPETTPHYITIPAKPPKVNSPFPETEEDIDIFPEDKNQLPRPPPQTSTPSTSIKPEENTEDFLISFENYTPQSKKPNDNIELFPTTVPVSTKPTTKKPKINTQHIDDIFNANTTKPSTLDSLDSFERLFAPQPTQPLTTTQPTKRITNEFEDFFITKPKRSKPSRSTTEPTVKIIYSDFYVASTANPTTNLDGFTTTQPTIQSSPATSQSVATSISYEIHNKTKQQQIKYRRAKVIKVKNVKDDDFVVYKAEMENEKQDINKSFDDLALSLVNHARSIDYLQNSAKTPKQRRKTVSRTRRLGKKIET